MAERQRDVHGRFGSLLLGARGQEARNRLSENNFDELRLVFACTVLFFHVAILSEVSAFRWMLNAFSGVLAVQCFFFVSGFLVTMSCERSSSLRSYFTKRVLRIAPAYLVVVVGAALFLSPMSSLGPRDYFKDSGVAKYVVSNLMLANFAAPSLPGVFATNTETAVNGSLWTIKIEAAFYCFVPVFLWASRRFGGSRVAGVLFLLSMAWFAGFTLAAAHLDMEVFDKLAKQLPGQLSFFMGGAWAYFRTRDGAASPRLWIALVAACAYAFTSGLLHQLIAPVAVTAMVYWLAISLPGMGRFGKYGDFSYGIYLYHFPLIQVFIALGAFQRAPLAALAWVCVAVFVTAFLSWHLVEKPFLRHKVRAGAPAA